MPDSNTWILITILMMLIGSLANQGNNLRLSRVERKLDLILKNLGIDQNAGVDSQVLELARAGKKIEAIKLYRTMTGVGLKEAKDYVESL